jgi:hypothetical protein
VKIGQESGRKTFKGVLKFLQDLPIFPNEDSNPGYHNILLEMEGNNGFTDMERQIKRSGETV